MQILVASLIGLVVAVYVLIPLSRSRSAVAYDWDGTDRAEVRGRRRDQIERDVLRYRAAVRAGTACNRCARANSPGSRFCAECGRPLPGAAGQPAEPEPVSG